MAKKSSKPPIIQVTKDKQDLRKKELPLVDIKITNPITYIKSWWRKIIGNEGVDFRFKVRPLTAIAISVIVVTVNMGIGRFVLPFEIPYFEYTSLEAAPASTVVENPWRQTAFSGELKFTPSSKVFYLLTISSEAITLGIPENVDLSSLVGMRIFATGLYNQKSRVLKVDDASGLEILPIEIEPVPTAIPTPTPVPVETTEPLSSESAILRH